MDNDQSTLGRRTPSPFGFWLRTGKWVPAQLADPALEVKFNPYHDPHNGQFTFKDGIGGTAAMTPRPKAPHSQRREMAVGVGLQRWRGRERWRCRRIGHRVLV